MRYFDPRAEKVYTEYQQYFDVSDEVWKLLSKCKEAMRRIDSDAVRNSPWRKALFDSFPIILNAFRAVQLLASQGWGAQAMIVLRHLWERRLFLEYIKEHKYRDICATVYLNFPHIERRRLARKGRDNAGNVNDTEKETWKEIVRNTEDDYKAAVKRMREAGAEWNNDKECRYWYEVKIKEDKGVNNIADMASRVDGNRRDYYLCYSAYSACVHAGHLATIAASQSESAFDIGPTGKWVYTTLLKLSEISLRLLSIYNQEYKLDFQTQIDCLVERWDRLPAPQND